VDGARSGTCPVAGCRVHGDETSLILGGGGGYSQSFTDFVFVLPNFISVLI
jgi:hypothetical protein